MPADAGDLWILITVAGVVILAAAIAYGMWKSSRTTPREEAMRDAATRAQYDETKGDERGG